MKVRDIWASWDRADTEAAHNAFELTALGSECVLGRMLRVVWFCRDGQVSMIVVSRIEI